jgi:hypothetical protein
VDVISSQAPAAHGAACSALSAAAAAGDGCVSLAFGPFGAFAACADVAIVPIGLLASFIISTYACKVSNAFSHQ